MAYRGANASPSGNWKTWIAELDLRTCIICKRCHGTIYYIDDIIIPEPPIHPNCRCIIDLLNAILAGTATIKGAQGADAYLQQYHTLPEYYLTKNEAMARGWYKLYLRTSKKRSFII